MQKLSLIIFLINVLYVYGLTENITTELCLGVASLPFKAIGVRVFNNIERGRKICYFSPKTSEHYFRIKINNLNLETINGVCPKFILSNFNNVLNEEITDTDSDVKISWQVPESPKNIFEADCNDYKTKIGEILDSKQPGFKIEFDYNPGNEKSPDKAFDVTLSSYLIGQSYYCPGNSHLCRSTNHVCVDESLACDNSDNCFDNSDEDDYKCTGRIGNIPMPLFVIIIIGCILFLIFLIMVVILLMRTNRDRQEKKKGNWRDYTQATYDESLYPISHIS